jgi:hypothetical protein
VLPITKNRVDKEFDKVLIPGMFRRLKPLRVHGFKESRSKANVQENSAAIKR